MSYTNWVERALDGAYWRAHRVKTDISYAIEQGVGFIGSSRWTVPGGDEDYILIDVPTGVTMRLYDRIVSIGGGPFDIDVLQVSSIDVNGTGFSKSCLNCLIAAEPTVDIRRGATNPIIENVREENFLPAQGGGRSSGVTHRESVYRVLATIDGLKLAYRVQNNDNKDHTINMTFVWSEEYASDD